MNNDFFKELKECQDAISNHTPGNLVHAMLCPMCSNLMIAFASSTSLFCRSCGHSHPLIRKDEA